MKLSEFFKARVEELKRDIDRINYDKTVLYLVEKTLRLNMQLAKHYENLEN